MRKITDLFESSRISNYDSTAIMQRELTAYARQMKGKLTKDLQVVMVLLDRYAITTSDKVEEIMNLPDKRFQQYAGENGIDVNDLKTLSKLLNKNEDKLRMLPMFQSDAERAAILAGKLALDDMTMDLETEVGRNAVVKQYMPLVIKIARQFQGKSNLDYKELFSAGLLGLTLAMNSYRKPKALADAEKQGEISDEFAKEADKEQKKSTSFLTWASYMIRSYILEDIKNLSRTVRVSVSAQQREYKKNREENGVGSITKSNTISTDALMARNTSKRDNDGGRSILDMNPHLNTVPDEYLGGADSNRLWKQVYEIIEKKFKVRDCRIFYRFMGLRNFEKVKNSEIAKVEGISPSNVTFIVKQIIEFMKTDPVCRAVLEEIYDRMVSNESVEYINIEEPKTIRETVRKVDVSQYGIDENQVIEEGKLYRLIAKVIATFAGKREFLDTILKYGREGNFNKIDDNYDKYGKEMKEFLSKIYPNVNWDKKSDVEVMKKFIEVAEFYDMHEE